MSCILYYSKYCEICKKYLQYLSKSSAQKEIHFICIDKRVKNKDNKTYILLDNGQQIILPDTITKVPALLLLTKNFQVIYGEQILEYFKPTEELQLKIATNNNNEPESFGFDKSMYSGVVSDNYSYYDMSNKELQAEGNGGLRQMYNYTNINAQDSPNIQNFSNQNSNENTIRGATKMKEESANNLMEQRIQQMKQEREEDMRRLGGNRPPI